MLDSMIFSFQSKIIFISAHQTILSANTVMCTTEIPHSSSDQTGMRQSRMSHKNFFCNTDNGEKKDANKSLSKSGDPNWQQFWPKKSPRPETFFRYNAKPALQEDKAIHQNIQEDILDSETSIKGNKNTDPFTTYLEKEKEKNRIRPKVRLSNQLYHSKLITLPNFSIL